MAGKLLMLYLTSLALSWAGVNGAQLDWVVDKILGKVVASIPSGQVSIHPISMSIEKDWTSIGYPVILNTTNGVLEDLSTMSRTSPALIYQGNNATVQYIKSILSLEKFSVSFEKVVGEAVGFQEQYFKGSLSVECSTNGFDLGVKTEKVDGICLASLTNSTLTSVSDCSWTLKGATAEDKFKALYIRPALITHFKDATSTFTDQMTALVQKILNVEDICQFLIPQ